MTKAVDRYQLGHWYSGYRERIGEGPWCDLDLDLDVARLRRAVLGTCLRPAPGEVGTS